MTDRPLALVTGASSGIGLELARLAAQDGCDLLIAANERSIRDVEDELRSVSEGTVEAVVLDLSRTGSVRELWSKIGERDVDFLMANAGRGLGHAFLDQDPDEIESVVKLNVTGTTELLHLAARRMRELGRGRILITGSIAGYIPGSYQAVYNATKAYLDILSWGIRNELADSGVTVTCLMPGPTDTEFFERAHMEGTPVAQSDKDDPADVARQGYRAMQSGKAGVTPGFMNKLQSSMAGVLPSETLAWLHRQMAEPEERT